MTTDDNKAVSLYQVVLIFMGKRESEVVANAKIHGIFEPV